MDQPTPDAHTPFQLSAPLPAVEYNALDKLLDAIAKHQGDNPDHGINCSCMDKYIQKFRQMTQVSAGFEQRRVDYVIVAALKGR